MSPQDRAPEEAPILTCNYRKWLRGSGLVRALIRGCNTSDGNGEWWWSMGVINEVMKTIIFKKILDLKAPAKGIKLCGALVAAALIAGHSSKRPADHHKEKYAVVTLTDCRPILDPPLSTHHFGFYHSAVLNTLSMKGGEKLWELARRSYMAFANSKNCNKHFSDMADLNFLMRKAIENPGLTSASSLRTSFLTVFEDPVFETNDEIYREIVGLEDYIGCASVHGIGPSIAIFDTIRGGMLDCACVYPSPLHSREQMEELLHNMKRLLVDAAAHNRVPNE
uniref:Uncharacterized protein n=1 Tax=Vitis vinifera TaxID=29760 RepID=A5AIS4_VITVI|nr:hypothetical protein VITISV_014690 [Vitis vinifera]